MIKAEPAFDTDGGDRGLLTLQDERRYQRIFEAQAARSYLYLSLGIGLIAAVFPMLLVISDGYQGHDSISSYYLDSEGSARNILVGCLCAIGAFLFLFHGLSAIENWLLNFAGIAIVMVAFIPPPVSTAHGAIDVHRDSAIVFFILIGIVAIFLSKDRVKYIQNEVNRKRFKRGYTIVGLLMIGTPAVAAIPIPLFIDHSVLLAEWAGTWSFAAYWFIKTFEYHLLLRVRWF